MLDLVVGILTVTTVMILSLSGAFYSCVVEIKSLKQQNENLKQQFKDSEHRSTYIDKRNRILTEDMSKTFKILEDALDMLEPYYAPVEENV